MCFVLFAWFTRAELFKTATGRACNECENLVDWDWTVSKCSDTNVVFQTAVFLIPVTKHYQENPLPFQNLFILPLSWFTFLLVTVLWIVWTCDCCFFADFYHGRSADCKKLPATLISLVYSIGFVDLIYFILHSTWGAPRQLKILMCKNEQKPELDPEPCCENRAGAEATFIKTNNCGAGAWAMLMKWRAPET